MNELLLWVLFTLLLSVDIINVDVIVADDGIDNIDSDCSFVDNFNVAKFKTKREKKRKEIGKPILK